VPTNGGWRTAIPGGGRRTIIQWLFTTSNAYCLLPIAPKDQRIVLVVRKTNYPLVLGSWGARDKLFPQAEVSASYGAAVAK
jgi:hypothetical protein